MQTNNQNQYIEEEISLRQLVTTLRDGKWWILIPTLLSSVIAVGYALLATPVYRAEALVQIREESKVGGGFAALAAQLGGLGDIAGIVGGQGGDRALALATIKSRVVIQGFINDGNLLPELFDDDWDVDSKRWNVDDPKDIPTLWHGYKLFAKDILEVSEDRKTDLVTVAIEWRDPDVAAAWATELVARTNRYLRDKAITEGEKNLDYLRQQAKQIGLVELQQASFALMESELKRLMLAKGSDEYAIKTIDPAQAPKLRTSPKRKQIVIVGFLLGGFIGIIALFVRKALSPRVVGQ